MRKYAPLRDHILNLEEDGWETTFSEIEAILGSALPRSARRYPAWWANHSHRGRHARAWLNIGWETRGVDMKAETVTFRRQGRLMTTVRMRRKAT